MKETMKQKKRSNIGVASLIITSLAALLFGLSYWFWSYCHSHYGYTDSLGWPIIAKDEDNIVFSGFAISALLVIGSMIIGIIGLFQRSRDKRLALLGILFSTLGLIGIFSIFYFDVTP